MSSYQVHTRLDDLGAGPQCLTVVASRSSHPTLSTGTEGVSDKVSWVCSHVTEGRRVHVGGGGVV